jgi:hypothetical protein
MFRIITALPNPAPSRPLLRRPRHPKDRNAIPDQGPRNRDRDHKRDRNRRRNRRRNRHRNRHRNRNRRHRNRLLLFEQVL